MWITQALLIDIRLIDSSLAALSTHTSNDKHLRRDCQRQTLLITHHAEIDGKSFSPAFANDAKSIS